MRFSVVIPAYNCEKFIRRAMLSVINQTHPQVELIVINDGSPDNTDAVVRQVMEEYPDFPVIYRKTENAGPSSARNRGIELATGDYICFLDSDDLYDTQLFARIAAIEEPFDICYFGWKEIREDTQEVFSQYTDRFAFLDAPISGLEAAKRKYRCQLWLCNCNEVYRTEMLRQKGIRYPEGIYSGEDTCFIYSCLLSAKQVVSLPENYFYNVYRENSLMHGSFSQRHMTELDALRYLKQYVRQVTEDAELHGMIDTLYYYCHITIAKKMVRSLRWTEGRTFVKLFRQHIPPREKAEGVVLSRRQRIEDGVLALSPVAFFLMCKIFYGIKGG